MQIQEITGIDVAGKIIEHIERNYTRKGVSNAVAAAAPGNTTVAPNNSAIGEDGVDWAALNALPHMQQRY